MMASMGKLRALMTRAGMMEDQEEDGKDKDAKSAPTGVEDKGQQAAQAGPDERPPTSNGRALALLDLELEELALMEV